MNDVYRCGDCSKEFGVWDDLLRHYCPTLGYGGGD